MIGAKLRITVMDTDYEKYNIFIIYIPWKMRASYLLRPWETTERACQRDRLTGFKQGSVGSMHHRNEEQFIENPSVDR